MGSTSVKVFVAGSKMVVFGEPWKGEYPPLGAVCRVPPLMNARPSGRTIMPLQNMSQFTVKWVIVPDAKSSSTAPEPLAGPYGGPDGHSGKSGEQFPDPVTIKILLL